MLDYLISTTISDNKNIKSFVAYLILVLILVLPFLSWGTVIHGLIFTIIYWIIEYD